MTGQRQVELRQTARRNLGIAHVAKLGAWAELIARAWPGTKVWMYGSALASKDFRDVDVVIGFPDAARYGEFNPDPNVHRLGSGWEVMAAAFSALGEQMTGLPVEARHGYDLAQWDHPITDETALLLAG